MGRVSVADGGGMGVCRAGGKGLCIRDRDGKVESGVGELRGAGQSKLGDCRGIALSEAGGELCAEPGGDL